MEEDGTESIFYKQGEWYSTVKPINEKLSRVDNRYVYQREDEVVWFDEKGKPVRLWWLIIICKIIP